MKTGFRGTFVISWSQTELDGLEAPPVSALCVGAAWSWRGDAVLVDRGMGVLRLDGAVGSEELRQRAARIVHRLVGAALARETSADARRQSVEPRQPDSSFVITDGARTYTATLIAVGRGSQPLIMFIDEVPPRNVDLWVVHHTVHQTPEVPLEPDGRGVICFTEGTRIATPACNIAVEDLRVGDLVLTKDNGPQPIEWIGNRHMSGARLFAMPRLRPVRIRAGALGVERPDQELLVSPEHRMLVSGPVARDLFNTPEVLVAARDLIDHRLIVTDAVVQCVRYIHLLLPQHNIVWANGVATESFHPASSAFSSIDATDLRLLLERHPELDSDLHSYGPFARRKLTPPEAAILLQAA